MSKAIDAVKNATIVITNTFDATAIDASPLGQLDGAAGKVWNTGLNVAEGAVATVAEPEAWEAKHIASVRLYKSNSYVTLAPGEKVTFYTQSSEESIYYATMKSDLLTVTSTPEVVKEESASV